MKPVQLFQRINFFITLAIVLLTPIFFLPLTSEFYEFNKQALLIIAASVSLVLWTLSFVLEHQVRLTRSPLGLPLLAILATWATSAFLRSPNRFDAFLDPGQAGTVIALVVLFFTSVNSIHTKRQLDSIVTTFITSFLVLAGVTLLWSSGLMEQILPVLFLKNSLWTPTGNPFSTLVILALIVPFLVILLFKDKSATQKGKTALLLTTLLLSVISISLLTYRLFFKPDSPNRPVFLSQSTSWAIALETLKASPLLGTGPSTFLSNFTRYRPISYNFTTTWAVRFASGSNYYLQLLSTVGILGLLSYLFLVLRAFRLFSKSWKTVPDSPLHALSIASTTTALLALACQLFLPTSVVYLTTVFILLIIATLSFKQLGSSLVHEANIDIVAASDSGSRSPILPWVGLLASIIVVLPALYFAGRAYAGEIYFQQALTAAAANDGKKTYDTLIQAIRTFPYKDSYRSVYAQTNLLLANSLAAGKKELSPDERTTITSLIQQSIREAKNAVALNPTRITNVENLAGIYRSLIPLAKGADVWTVASYREAMRLDPVNPNIRISLGGVFYGAKNYDEAIRLFQSAVDLKPDHANAHYNLSAAYREKGDFQKSATSLATVINLVPKDSADYTKAIAELEELKVKAGEQATIPTTPTAPAQTELEAPKPLPSPLVNPPLDLPADLGPETTPTPTSAPQSTSPTPTP